MRAKMERIWLEERSHDLGVDGLLEASVVADFARTIDNEPVLRIERELRHLRRDLDLDHCTGCTICSKWVLRDVIADARLTLTRNEALRLAVRHDDEVRARLEDAHADWLAAQEPQEAAGA